VRRLRDQSGRMKLRNSKITTLSRIKARRSLNHEKRKERGRKDSECRENQREMAKGLRRKGESADPSNNETRETLKYRKIEQRRHACARPCSRIDDARRDELFDGIEIKFPAGNELEGGESSLRKRSVYEKLNDGSILTSAISQLRSSISKNAARGRRRSAS